MFTRTKKFGTVQISATFQWDEGDSSVGIPAGWGEETGVQIIAPLNFRENGNSIEVGAAFVTWITWRDVASDGGIDPQDPATWIVDDVDGSYRDADGKLHMLAEISNAILPTYTIPGNVLRLSELPEVLEVVREAHEDYKASERLLCAQETLILAEDYLDEVSRGLERLDPDEEVINAAKVELDQARREYAHARRHADERGIA